MANARVRDVDLGWNKFFKAVRGLGYMVQAGFVGDKGQRQEASGLTVAEVATINELGAPSVGVPERAFLRTTWDARRRSYFGMLAAYVRRVTEGAVHPIDAFGAIGQAMEDDIRTMILSGTMAPANAPSTIKRKGFDHPLLETGLMADSVSFAVVKDGKVVGGTGDEP